MTPRLNPFADAPATMQSWLDFGKSTLQGGLEVSLMELVTARRLWSAGVDKLERLRHTPSETHRSNARHFGDVRIIRPAHFGRGGNEVLALTVRCRRAGTPG
jgi:hypothetical protein